MQDSRFANDPRRDDGGQSGPSHRMRILTDAGLTAAICLYLSSFGAGVLFAAYLSVLLQVAAFTTAAMATFDREPLFKDDFTRWDMAALFLLGALIVGWFVDPDLVAQALEQARENMGVATTTQ